MKPKLSHALASRLSAVTAAIVFSAATLSAEPPVTLENHLPPTPNLSNEPLAESFSYRRAVRFADHAAMDWQESHGCVTCHTNGLYLAARPAAGFDAPAYQAARAFATGYLKSHLQPSKDQPPPRGGIEAVVATTALLAISDMKTEGRLRETTRRFFDHVWKKQDESGAWTAWAKCHWGPYEVDDHFGVTLAALAIGMAGNDDYSKSPAAIAGTNKLRTYLKKHPPASLHQSGMMLWASAHLEGLADQAARNRWINDLFAAQQDDGGWVLPQLGNDDWKRADGKTQSTRSDAYATAFAVHVLTEAGVPHHQPRLAMARQWLRNTQRQSGRWFTRSPRKDNKHYISHAATNFALLALAPPEEKK